MKSYISADILFISIKNVRFTRLVGLQLRQKSWRLCVVDQIVILPKREEEETALGRSSITPEDTGPPICWQSPIFYNATLLFWQNLSAPFSNLIFQRNIFIFFSTESNLCNALESPDKWHLLLVFSSHSQHVRGHTSCGGYYGNGRLVVY